MKDLVNVPWSQVQWAQKDLEMAYDDLENAIENNGDLVHFGNEVYKAEKTLELCWKEADETFWKIENHVDGY